MPVIDPTSACSRLGGVARTSELRSFGVAARALAEAVRTGELRQPRRGLYTLADIPDAASHALRHGGLIACVTAARAYRLWTLDAGIDEPAHVWVDRDRRFAGGAGCRCIHHRDVPSDVGSRWRVGIVHCLTQLASCKGDEAFFAALESALRQGLISHPQRAALRRALPRRQRWLVDFARCDADSGLESLLRLRLHLLGITVQTQVSIGGVGTVDFVIGDRLIVETDGTTHDGPNRHRDLVRDAMAASLGFLTLRFDTAMIIHDWDLVQTAILAILDRNGHLHRVTR